jgi:hypothetical protein
MVDFPDPLGDGFGVVAAAGDEGSASRVGRRPHGEIPLPEVVLVIEAQLFEARPRHIGQPQLCFFGGPTGFAPLGNVLHSAPGCLHHLIMGAAAPVDVSPAEPHRDVVAKLSELKTPQIPVPPVLWNQWLLFHPPPLHRLSPGDWISALKASEPD